MIAVGTVLPTWSANPGNLTHFPAKENGKNSLAKSEKNVSGIGKKKFWNLSNFVDLADSKNPMIASFTLLPLSNTRRYFFV